MTDPTTCPTCGSPVTVYTSDYNTSYYVPAAARITELEAALQAVIDYIPEGFYAPMDDDDAVEYRAIARAALRAEEPTDD